MKRKTQRKKKRSKRRLVKKQGTQKSTDRGLKKLNCSPKPKHEINGFTCYTDRSLFKMRDLWNARHPDAKIETNDTKAIHSSLTNYFKGVCNKESCWLTQIPGVSYRDMEESFAPESPEEWSKNPNEWLTSVDIMKVMKQYERAYKCFDFIGPSPIDFDTRKLYGDCVWEELCNFSLAEQIKNDKTKIGIIINTDPHDKPGQHWISMFINIKKRTISFFDSVGDKAPPQVMAFVDRIIKQGHQMNPKINMKFDQNHPREHQYGTTECGIYSLFFIVHLLEDKITEHYMKTHILKDAYMQNFRKIYFNESL